MKATIYHNPKCSKSRETLRLLKENNVDVEVIEYLKNPPTKKKLRKILLMLNMNPGEILRNKENVFKEKYEDKNLTENEILGAMIKTPILIERPIVILGEKAVLGRPPENVLKII